MATLTLIPNSLVRFAYGTPDARTAVILKDGSFLQVKPTRQKFANGDEWSFSFMGPEATLYHGVESGKLSMEKQPKELVNLQDEDGNTALHRLINCLSDPYDELVRLLEEGADPNIRNKKGETPLCVAVKGGWFEGVRKLAEYNADPNIQMPNGDYLLNYAAKIGCWKLNCLLSHTKPDMNIQSQDGSTVLHQVIRDRNLYMADKIDMVKILVKAGVDKTIQDNAGFTALHYAAIHYGSSHRYSEAFVPLLSA